MTYTLPLGTHVTLQPEQADLVSALRSENATLHACLIDVTCAQRAALQQESNRVLREQVAMTPETFWSHVDCTAGPDACWPWTGRRTDGYGAVGSGQQFDRAHRVSFRLSGGIIPPGQIVRHLCHNPLCCNPDHLAAGTHADNMHDMAQAGRGAGTCSPAINALLPSPGTAVASPPRRRSLACSALPRNAFATYFTAREANLPNKEKQTMSAQNMYALIGIELVLTLLLAPPAAASETGWDRSMSLTLQQ